MMPLDLILIRHGESEGNVAGALARQGDEPYYTDAFVTTPGREWQLTETGQKQVQIMGQHLRKAEFPTAYPQLRKEETTRFYCSPYVSPELDHAKGLPRGDLLHQ
ncbi:phosphoglycerate mutase family protein [Nesterenkonia alkaliphila]|nr:phosphoglycerate mutase family protein [Nesterenkonia alkaliphila]